MHRRRRGSTWLWRLEVVSYGEVFLEEGLGGEEVLAVGSRKQSKKPTVQPFLRGW